MQLFSLALAATLVMTTHAADPQPMGGLGKNVMQDTRMCGDYAITNGM